MKVYEVGGAVRDGLLGLNVAERDYVVIGQTPEAMMALGFRPVGKDFPVFLHPTTREEYALARTERKTAPGYHGFSIEASPSVSLEEDLIRRDLTVNAMARAPDGRLIDPYGGLRDLDQRLLRHVSPAFVEDPVRILRVARFAARFKGLGFRVASETLALMTQMVGAGEVDALVPERVFLEFQKALLTDAPEVFIEVLRACGALARLMPEIDRLFGLPGETRHTAGLDVGQHSLKVLQIAARLSPDPLVRFAALCHDLGQGTAPEPKSPSQRSDQEGLAYLQALASRLRLPKGYLVLASKVLQSHKKIHDVFALSAEDLLELLDQLDGLRQPDRVGDILLACAADFLDGLGSGADEYPQADYLMGALALVRAVSGAELKEQGLQGKRLGDALHGVRLEAIQRWMEAQA